jgi:cellulose synthase/poly-beta-1,6-N-acetylglucosamine synthase-like glycosyltransferase
MSESQATAPVPSDRGPPQTPAYCTVVIPTYNERENIAALLSRIIADPRFKALVVDDNSPDGTGEVVAELARDSERIKLLARPGKLGLGTAYVAGFKQALADDAQFIFEWEMNNSALLTTRDIQLQRTHIRHICFEQIIQSSTVEILSPRRRP